MKKLIFLTCALVLILSVEGISQDDKKMTRKERKEAKKKEREENLKGYLELANQKAYALQAETIMDSKNARFNTDPSLNFIAVNGDKVKIQMALSTVGGWTGDNEDIVTEADLNQYDVTQPKNVEVEMLAKSAQLGTVDIVLLIDPSGTGRAYIDNQYGGRITLIGPIIPLSESFIFEQSGGY